MFKQVPLFLLVALMLYSSFDHHFCLAQISGVSWIYRGTAQQNNSALTFNQYDTLNLICKATGSDFSSKSIFAVSKGSSTPTAMALSAGSLTVTNVGTLIWSDIDGTQAGFENFIIYTGFFTTNSDFDGEIIYYYRYVNVGTLATTDTGVYHCSVTWFGEGTGSTGALDSGALTITVNTKADQAHSTRSQVNSVLAYSAVIMSASKLLL